MTNTIKVGKMPGRIDEYALAPETTVAQALQEAGIQAEGHEVKVDGNTVTNLETAIGSANVILVTKKVKGNNTVKIGKMPGRIDEYALESSTTVAEALAEAGLDASGHEVKIDGNTVTDFNAQIGGANVILLTKKVKGNNTVKIGKMPGRIDEYALDQSTTVAQAIAEAGLSVDGYEVKADGTTVTNLDAPIGGANVILLTKKVKGNK